MAENNEINFSLNTEQSEKEAADLTAKLDKATDSAIKFGAEGQKSIDAVGDAASRLASKVQIIVSQTTRATQTRVNTTAQRKLDELDRKGLSPAQIAQQDFERDIGGKLKGNTKLIEERTNIYNAYLGKLQQVEAAERRALAVKANEDLRNKAIKASQDTTGSDRFLAAERNLQREKQKTLELNQKIIKSELERLQLTAATPADRVGLGRADSLRKLSQAGASPSDLTLATTSFAREDALRKAAELDALRNKAIRASKDTSASDAFLLAEQRLNTEKQKTIANNIKIRETEVANAKYRAATPIERVALDRAAAVNRLTKAGGTAAEVAALEKSFKDVENTALGATKNIGARIAEFITSPTYAARKSLGEFLQDFGKFGIIAGGILIGTAVLAKEAFDLIRNSGKQAEEFANLGEKLGVSATEAATLSIQARIAGVSIDALGGLVRKLSTNLSGGGTEARATVRELNNIGVSVAAAGNNFRNHCG